MIKQPKQTEDKQLRINQLRHVYQQILRNFDKQSVKIKMNQTKYRKSPFSDDTLLFKAHKTLPKLEIEHPYKTRNKYYSNKLIVNQSVYIHERKQTSYRQLNNIVNSQKLQKKVFQKLDIPNALKDQSVLSQRNRRILQLYKRVQKDGTTPIKITSVRKAKKSSHVFNIEQRNVDQDIMEQQLKGPPTFEVQGKCQSSQVLSMRPSDKKMITILKQVKQRKSKLQFPKMKSNRARSSLLIDLQNKSKQKMLKCTKIFNSKQQTDVIHSQTDEKVDKDAGTDTQAQKQKQKQKQKPSPTKIRFKSVTKLDQDRGSIVNIRKRKFNWRNEPLNIQKITRDQFYSLNRGYLKINTIQQINSGFYRAYIGAGNNSQVVKKTLKERGCWTIVDSLDDDPHFVWTQFKYAKFYDQLPAMSTQNCQSCFVASFSEQLTPNLVEKQLHQELHEFIKAKNNQFTLGCQKILSKPVFQKLMRSIKQKFKNNSYLQHYRKLRYYALQCFSSIKYSLMEAEKQPLKANQIKLHNHIDGAGAIGDKKGLNHYLNRYTQLFDDNIDQIVPTTLHIDPQNFTQGQLFQKIPGGPWILKPGEATNRGQGITIHITRQSLLSQLAKKKKHYHIPTLKYTNIVQQYIFPLLYSGRKFDIRIWILWNSRSKQAWWYQQGYIRTSSKQFTLKSTNKFIHLTNDAIQSQSQDYGKYEPGNKISFNQFNKYLQNQYGYKQFNQKIVGQMKQIAQKVFRIGNLVFDQQCKQNTFQLFGFDYLIDTKFKPWLIECNTNPCLQIGCSLLARLVPNMLDNLMNLTVDTYFPVPTKKKPKESQLWNHQSFKFQLLYDANQDIEIKQKILTNPNVDIAYTGQYQEVMNQ